MTTKLTEEEIAQMAQEALEGQDPEKTRDTLRALLERSEGRPDLLHALAATELATGEAEAALAHITEAERGTGDSPESEPFRAALLHTRAAAYEDLSQPEAAADTYRRILTLAGGHARALQALGHLLLAWGRPADGLQHLRDYLADGSDEADHLEATSAFLRAAERLQSDDVHPTMFLEAHREGYCGFFDHHAERMAAEGWIAEAAIMMRNELGDVVPKIPDGAPAYAAVRVDLVDPSSGQRGQVGERPMVVALENYEAVAQAPVLVDWPEDDHPFAVWVSTQAPWDHLPIHVRFEDPDADAVALFEPLFGEWYETGWGGAFGESDRGRFHDVVPPVAAGAGGCGAYVDMGRTSLKAIDDLRDRLTRLHGEHPLRSVLFGRGFVPS